MPAFCSLLLPNHYAKNFAGEIDGSLDLIHNKILEKIHRACYFSVLADEATDVANDVNYQLAFAMLMKDLVFMGFHKYVSGVTGQAISNDILSQLEKWQLQLQGKVLGVQNASGHQIPSWPKYQEFKKNFFRAL